MRTQLTEAGWDLYELLTNRTFYVVDTEYTSANDERGGNRLISIAIVPVVGGKRVSAGQEFYREMNPGAPISADSSRIHGFTDVHVAGKRDFNYYAPAILAALNDTDGVFVAHTAADIRVLRGELERLDDRAAAGEAGVTAGISDLPLQPLIDTSTLARLVKYPDLGPRPIVSLRRLAELTGVKYAQAHNARADARATADALIELLAHAAQTAAFWDLDALLTQHHAGTTHAPKGPAYIRSRRPTDPELPTDHIAKHVAPLTDPATIREVEAWVALATECAQLRCQWLRDEAKVAAHQNAAVLLDPLVAVLPTLTEAGQAGTLLGAVSELITATDLARERGLAYTRALKWWRTQRPLVQASSPCGSQSTEACPACRAGEACPRDVLYQPVAVIATLGSSQELSGRTIHDKLFGNREDRRIHSWKKDHPEIAGYMAWMVVTWEQDNNRQSSSLQHLVDAIATGVHKHEPRLALLACESISVSDGLDPAIALAEEVLEKRNTDPAYGDLGLWLTWTRQGVTEKARKQPKKPTSHPRLARPPGRDPVNPYAVR